MLSALRPDFVAARPLSGLATLLGVPEPEPDAQVTGITHDSRAVRPGDVYAALAGANVHGADFAAQAVAAGAVAILTDPEAAPRAASAGVPVLAVAEPRAVLGTAAAWVYGEPSRDLLVLGITGTNGKTTTAFLVEGGLRAAGHRTGLVGTVAIRVGDEEVASVRTTPEATDLHALFAVMRERGVTAAVFEVSSHALAYGRVGGVRFDVAGFTNLSEDHLDFHPDLEDYFRTKSRLFTRAYSRRAVVCVDGAWGKRLAGEASIPVVTCAVAEPSADWHATNVRLRPDGTAFDAVSPTGAATPVSVRLPGEFNAANALLAVAMLAEAGVPVSEAAAGVAAVPGVPGRMERVVAGQPFLAVVDYAHTPDAVERLLEAVREVTRGRLVLVLGCGGDRDRAKRPLMGAAAARLADVAVLTSDNPRGEDPLAILDAMREGAATVPASERADVVVEPDRRAAITLAVARAGADDTVVVAGKGHEQGQYIGDRVHPFDDRVVLQDAIGDMENQAS
ncbi:MAG: UDP-N-acetylmuramoyl-L-alanyl-D-glutamate--2,6-diaminopimelate ligase [Streptosporangiales bacterium]|nr:UDP-N-acetylmuramoyl-L-alanyl-D-glutamate--2,6-diaminopimelate ligase [Streptosporangiales bacterium]MBO0891923.1 UDP-N-acetylmuramoyl-L-alanyl-D-glutamate--2,6-diaminopimelate ligase [Acidothermales bacterium]